MKTPKTMQNQLLKILFTKFAKLTWFHQEPFYSICSFIASLNLMRKETLCSALLRDVPNRTRVKLMREKCLHATQRTEFMFPFSYVCNRRSLTSLLTHQTKPLSHNRTPGSELSKQNNLLSHNNIPRRTRSPLHASVNMNPHERTSCNDRPSLGQAIVCWGSSRAPFRVRGFRARSLKWARERECERAATNVRAKRNHPTGH